MQELFVSFILPSGCAGLNAHEAIAERVMPLGVNNRLILSAWDTRIIVSHTFFSVVWLAQGVRALPVNCSFASAGSIVCESMWKFKLATSSERKKKENPKRKFKPISLHLASVNELVHRVFLQMFVAAEIRARAIWGQE